MRTIRIGYLVTLVTCLLLIAGTGAIAYAKVQPTVSPPQNIIVSSGERMESLFLYNQSGTIAGAVTDEVLVINGDITLASSARIGDRVIIIGGHLNREPGSVIGKGIFEISAGNITTNLLLAALAGVALLTIVKFVVSVTMILLLLFVAAFWPGLSRRSSEIIQQHPFKTSLLGILGTFALLSLIIALLLSQWGIPLALILLLGGGVLILPGAAGLALSLGDVINRGTGGRISSSVVIAALGSLPLVSLLNFPIIGSLWVLLLVAANFGTGLQLIWRPKPRLR